MVHIPHRARAFLIIASATTPAFSVSAKDSFFIVGGLGRVWRRVAEHVDLGPCSGVVRGENYLWASRPVECVPAPGTRPLLSNMLCRPTGGDNCVTRVLRGKARNPNDQDVVDPELGSTACFHVQGGNIPYCGGIMEEIHGGWLPGGEVRV